MKIGMYLYATHRYRLCAALVRYGVASGVVTAPLQRLLGIVTAFVWST